jgi:acetyl esterase/lipase
MYETLPLKLRSVCRGLIPALASLVLAGCSAITVVNALTPNDGYALISGIPYGDDPRQRLDIYQPETPVAGTPLVVFFYGGGWDSGAREDYKFVGQAFAAQGYTFAIPDYRLYPQVGWRGFMSDAAMAVASLNGRFPGVADGSRPFVLAGHSAGAYIAAMLALDPSWLAGQSLDPCIIDSVIGLAGPYDFLPLLDPKLQDIFGSDPEGAMTQPVQHVNGKAPPMLLITGLDDKTVSPRNSRALADQLRNHEAAVELKTYDGVDHAGLIGALSVPFRFLAPTHADVFAYLAGQVSKSRSACQVGQTG